MDYKEWAPDGIVPPGQGLDEIVARFMGYEVKTLHDWGEKWYPFVENRATFARGAWLVSDGDAFVEAEYEPGTEGQWSVSLIEEYSTKIVHAWEVYERILHDHDPSATIHRSEIGLWNDYAGPRELITGLTAPHAISLAAKYLWERSEKPAGPVAR